MSQTLYRKYRPSKFDEVLGQEQVVSILKNALKTENISHAYIFAGTRGTGKTSVARIFAESLGTSGNDLYEVDAASNRGIDDIRAIRDAVSTMPFESRYKVYIVDEAHMLTKEAWNALLKTLEEPPAHVIFILATTELEKIPDTILSRCETHKFKKPTLEILRTVVSKTAKKEGFDIDTESADLIATLADGSFRDAHGTLQKVISGSGVDNSGKTITRQLVEKITGAPKIQLVEDFLEHFAKRDLSKTLTVLSDVAKESQDVLMFAKLLIETMRAVLLFKVYPPFTKEFEAKNSLERVVFIKKLSEIKNSPIRADNLREFLVALEETPRSHIPELPLELVVLKILTTQETLA